MTTCTIPRTDVDGDLQRSAALRVANVLRDLFLDGLVVRVVPFGPTTAPDGGDRRTVQIVRDGEVLRFFTPEQVLNAHVTVLAHMIRTHGAPL